VRLTASVSASQQSVDSQVSKNDRQLSARPGSELSDLEAAFYSERDGFTHGTRLRLRGKDRSHPSDKLVDKNTVYDEKTINSLFQDLDIIDAWKLKNAKNTLTEYKKTLSFESKFSSRETKINGKPVWR
jgi:hypothetical protein